ncbi:MAG: alpha/beta fold hydrolase [Chloroflexota bacterium]
MNIHPLDTRQVINNLFHVRKTIPNEENTDEIADGSVQVDDDISIGYRLYIKHSSAPVLLFFHGNGEIATDYGGIAPFYHTAGLSLLVVDYRGYGWSDGAPLTTKLLPDAEKVFEQIDSILSDSGVVPNRPLFIMGRSLGSAPAIYVAMNNPDRLKGLIIESGYADAPSLFGRLGIRIPKEVEDDLTLPIGNAEKIKQMTIPLLVIHGEQDTLIPVYHGEKLHEHAGTNDKRLLIIPDAGHNNVSFVDIRRYFDAIKQFVDGLL